MALIDRNMSKAKKTTTRYFIASCYEERFERRRPSLATIDKRTTVEQLTRRLKLAQSLTVWRLMNRCSSRHLELQALWLVLKPVRVTKTPGNGLASSARVEVLFAGRPMDVWKWLHKQGLPVPSDDTQVIRGLNGQSVKGDRGVVLAGRFGKAAVGNGGVAKAFLGEATVAEHGVAIVTGGTATGGSASVAVCVGRGTAQTGWHGVAACLDEYATAVAGSEGVAVAGFLSDAIVGPNGVAISTCGTARAGHGGILVFREKKDGVWQSTVFKVGEGAIKPDVPYRYDSRSGKLIEDRRSTDPG